MNPHFDGIDGLRVPAFGVGAHALQHDVARSMQHVPVHVWPVFEQLCAVAEVSAVVSVSVARTPTIRNTKAELQLHSIPHCSLPCRLRTPASHLTTPCNWSVAISRSRCHQSEGLHAQRSCRDACRCDAKDGAKAGHTGRSSCSGTSHSMQELRVR